MPLNKDIKRVLVIGSGPIVIGQAAEFDYAGTQACRALKQEGLEVILINSNPATIMTDNAMADKIYIEPLTLETVKRVIKKERPDSLLSTLGGQTGLTLSMQLAKEGFLDKYNVKLLGANPETIDKAEDRQMFKDTMESIGQPCIPSKVVNTVEDAVDFANQPGIGYPLIIRPAFTLGGTGGGIVNDEEELKEITRNGLYLSPITQVLVEKCIAGDYSTVITNTTSEPIQYDLKVSGLDKASSNVSVWETRGPDSIDGSYDENYFKKTEDITPTENGGAYTYSVTVKPNSIVTISTVTPKRTEYKNADESERTVLKLPYSDDFEYAGYPENYLSSRGNEPRYTTDQGGAFEVEKTDKGNMLVQQITADMKANEWGYTPEPVTTFGDDRWYNYSVNVDAAFTTSQDAGSNYVGVGLRYSTSGFVLST